MIRVEHIFKSFSGKPVLQNLTFEVNPSETLSILGRSGCGKTTMLKIISGLEECDSGEIFFDEKKGSELKPSQRNTVYLYQEPLLFPHLNVFENIAFGLKLRKVSSKIIGSKTAGMIRELELCGHEKKMPNQLSGGQKQRAAFGRALIIEPRLLLLDEPFGNLDVETKASMQQLFKRITMEHQITSLFVTHDLKEAIKMGDRIAYMEPARLKVYDCFDEFRNDPQTGFKEEIEFWKLLEK